MHTVATRWRILFKMINVVNDLISTRYQIHINFIQFYFILFYISCFILLYKFISSVYISSTYTCKYHKLLCWIVVIILCKCYALYILDVLWLFWFVCLYAYISYILYSVGLFLALLRLYWISRNKDKNKDNWRLWIKFSLSTCCVHV